MSDTSGDKAQAQVDATRDPASRAATAARALGVALMFISLIILAFAVAVIRSNDFEGTVIMIVIVAIYVVPGIALLRLSHDVRKGRRGPTIATLVIATVIAVLLWIGVAAQGLLIASYSSSNVSAFVSLILIAVIAVVATMPAIYCSQSLRFPDRVDPQRGFEPMMLATPVAEPDPQVERQP